MLSCWTVQQTIGHTRSRWCRFKSHGQISRRCLRPLKRLMLLLSRASLRIKFKTPCFCHHCTFSTRHHWPNHTQSNSSTPNWSDTTSMSPSSAKHTWNRTQIALSRFPNIIFFDVICLAAEVVVSSNKIKRSGHIIVVLLKTNYLRWKRVKNSKRWCVIVVLCHE